MLFRDYEYDPLSPPEGEATQGEQPLEPHSFSHGFICGETLIFLLLFANLMSGYPIIGDAPAAGSEAKVAVAPKSVR